MRLAVAALGVACAHCWLAKNCSEYACDKLYQARVTPLPGSSVTWNGESFVPEAAASTGGLAEGMCAASIEPTEPGAAGFSGGSAGKLIVQCTSGGRHLRLTGLVGDLRDIPDSDRKDRLGGGGWSTSIDDEYQDCVYGTVKISVTNAVGGSLPFPQGVTPDYARDISISIQTDPMNCEQIDALLMFSTRSGDYRTEIGATCEVCPL